MFFNFEIAYKCSVYGNNSKSYIKFIIKSIYYSDSPCIERGIIDGQGLKRNYTAGWHCSKK